MLIRNRMNGAVLNEIRRAKGFFYEDNVELSGTYSKVEG